MSGEWIEIGDTTIFNKIENDNGVVPLDAFININNREQIIVSDVRNDDEYVEASNVSDSMSVFHTNGGS
tara:strand:+ start:3510 stop:3716 length:207 start_codon:yes stop_codon:yes gene_type:complete